MCSACGCAHRSAKTAVRGTRPSAAGWGSCSAKPGAARRSARIRRKTTMKSNKLRRITAAALVLALVLPQGAVAAPPEIETDEAVYINLDPYGIPEATRIVKGVNLNGHTEFTDYGDYTEVYNMST